MANSCQLFIFLTIFVPSAFAVDHIVGDNNGWTDGFNYTSWVEGKTFYHGDNLIFKYEKGSHNVFRVNITEFQECKILGNQPIMDTGNDVIPLKAGKKWYICSVEDHCAAGQKLVITVLDQLAPAPSPLPNTTLPPPPPSTATKSAVSGHLGFIVMVFAILCTIVT